MNELDLRDRRILYELDCNSRQSLNEIAKRLRISKTAVLYRIRKMQQEGVIGRMYALLNFGKLGYISFSIYLKFQSMTPSKRQELIDFLKAKDSVVWVGSVDGEYDLGVFVLVKTVKEINILWRDLLSRYKSYIEERMLTITTKSFYFPRSFLVDRKQDKVEILSLSEPEEISIDERDRQILRLLAFNSRTPIVEIAEKSDITPKTAIARIRKLEKEGIISGYVLDLNFEKIGVEYFKIQFRLSDSSKEENTKERLFLEYAKQHQSVTAIWEDLGGEDMEIDVQIKDLRALRSFIDEINSKFADIIKNYKVISIYKSHKYLLLPPGF